MYRTGIELRMYRLVFVSSCFLFYILQRWFRNVYKRLSKNYRIFPWCFAEKRHSCNPPPPPPPPPPPKTNIWRFSWTKSICEASPRKKYFLSKIKLFSLVHISEAVPTSNIPSVQPPWPFCKDWTISRSRSTVTKSPTWNSFKDCGRLALLPLSPVQASKSYCSNRLVKDGIYWQF
jgi:hypothetical protein